MAIFASTTLGTSDPSRAMSIKALEARANALQAAQAKQEMPTSLPSPWQGASLLANTAADAFAAKRADQQVAEQKAQLSKYMAGLGDNPTMAQVGPIMGADPDTGRALMAEIQQRRQQAALFQQQREMAAENARLAEAAAVAQEGRLGARPQTDIARVNAALKQGQETPEEAEAEKKKLLAGSPAEQKAAAEQQDLNIELQSQLAGLQEAHGLLKKGTVYSGGGAETKEAAGKFVPDWAGKFVGVSSEQTKDTQRYNQIVSPQVLEVLNRLKGSSSDRDMNFAIDTLNDRSADADTKRKALETLIPKLSARLAASNQRLETSGNKPVKVETQNPATAVPTAGAAGGGVQSVASEAEAMALPAGTRFKLPDGRTGTAR